MLSFAKLVEQCGFGQAVVITAAKQPQGFFDALRVEQWWQIYKAAPRESDLRKSAQQKFSEHPESFNTLMIKFHVQDMTVSTDQAKKEKELALVLAAYKAETTERFIEIVNAASRACFWECFSMSMDLLVTRTETYDELKAVHAKAKEAGWPTLADMCVRKMFSMATEFEQFFDLPCLAHPDIASMHGSLSEFREAVLDKLLETATTPQQWGRIIARINDKKPAWLTRRGWLALNRLLASAESVQDLQLEVLTASISQSAPLFGLSVEWKRINARTLELSKTVEDHVYLLEIYGLPETLRKKLRRRLEKLPKTFLQRARCLWLRDKGHDKEQQELELLASTFEEHKAVYDTSRKRRAESLDRMVAVANTVEQWIVIKHYADKGSKLAQTADERIAALVEV